ncbi:MAG TPA: PHP domain-containing protein [Spirochaetales bacterium]|nr:PHP domain-containing protein [Spirochaetales bacterium]
MSKALTEKDFSDGMINMTDLHTHSTASDGTLTPAQLIETAASLGLKALSLTDHDTVDGLEAGENESRKAGIQFIPGIEIEVKYSKGEFHLLGLGIWEWKGKFQEQLKTLQTDRYERNLSILAKMRSDGILADYEEIEALAQGKIVGRPHFARYLVLKGIASSIEDAFHRFISPGGPYYVRKKSLSLREAADLIHSAGGKAIIAHPLSLCLEWNQMEPAFRSYQDQGIDGIEAYHPNANLFECKRLQDIAERIGLLISAGSDFHGPHIPYRKLGRTTEEIWIEDTFALPYLQSRPSPGKETYGILHP